MSKFMHDNEDTKAIAIPWVFSENCRAKNTMYTCDLEICLVSMLFYYRRLLVRISGLAYIFCED